MPEWPLEEYQSEQPQASSNSLGRNLEPNMGFQLEYAEVYAYGLVLHLLYFLGHIRSLVLALFNSAGLSDFLIPDMVVVVVPDALARSPEHKPSRDVIRGTMPVVRYEELADDPPESCVVCLYEFKGGDEIRWLCRCRHVFHRSCLDRWIDCDQDTCPLCRARLVADLPEPIV